MLEISNFEEIIQVRMSREMDGKPLFWVAAYLIDGLLIDTGCSYTASELLGYLEQNPPQMVVNTHFHEDHIGANRLIRERLGIDIYAHSDSLELIGQPAKLFPYQEIVWGYPDPSGVGSIPSLIHTGRFTFEVIETPGHSVGHIVLLERSKGWCFCGDIYASDKVKTIRPEEDMGATAASIKKLAETETDRLILFTSAGGIIENGREALKRYIEYLEDLSRKAKDLQNRGQTVQEIMTSIFGGEHKRALMTDGQYTTENLIRSVLKMEC
jgi:glyoxylase-like metal-dependent hydrolase (beta-lactamase superfamily II)